MEKMNQNQEVVMEQVEAEFVDNEQVEAEKKDFFLVAAVKFVGRKVKSGYDTVKKAVNTPVGRTITHLGAAAIGAGITLMLTGNNNDEVCDEAPVDYPTEEEIVEELPVEEETTEE